MKCSKTPQNLQSRTYSKESYPFSLGGLEGCCLSQASIHRLDHQFGCLLRPAGQLTQQSARSIQHLQIFHDNNAKPNISLQKLQGLSWEVLLHPPYSPNLVPSDFQLFVTLQNSFKGQTFNFKEGIKIHLEEFLTSKDRKFFEQEIMDLATRWQKILKQNQLNKLLHLKLFFRKKKKKN